MQCTGCASTKIFARGLCKACYSRQRRNGTTERKNVVNRGACAVQGCDRQSFAKNMCLLHYQRAKHPLSNVWRSLRTRAPGDYPKAWNRFDAFLADVGERPSPQYQLRRIVVDEPWSKNNFKWLAPIGLSCKQYHKEYFWRWHLRNRYGITVEQVEAMNKAQGGRCAICRGSLGAPRPDGKVSKVCVDHDHVTRKVRGLLCDSCNKGLGAFNDNGGTLRAAVAYLDSHAVDAPANRE